MSKLEQEHATMLEEALKRPGIREVMEVYESWQRADKGLDSYRLATKEAFKVTTTNHTTPKSAPPKETNSCQIGVRFQGTT